MTTIREKTAMMHTIGNSSFCSKVDVLSFARECGNRHGWESLCARKDVSPKEAILYTKESGYWILWFSLLKRVDVLEYLQNLSPAEAIIFAKKMHEAGIWKIILKRKDISIEQAIDLAKTIASCHHNTETVADWRMSDPSIWKIVLGRIDLPLNEAISYAKEYNKLNSSELWEGITNREDLIP